MTKAKRPFICAVAVGLIAASLMASAAWAQDRSQLLGDWRSPDGTTVARVAPCASGASLCATVIADGAPRGARSSVGRVMVRDIRPAAGGWRGAYGSAADSLPAEIRLTAPDRLQMRVCADVILCQTARYQRVRD